jgi:hypothetical protein
MNIFKLVGTTPFHKRHYERFEDIFKEGWTPRSIGERALKDPACFLIKPHYDLWVRYMEGERISVLALIHGELPCNIAKNIDTASQELYDYIRRGLHIRPMVGEAVSTAHLTALLWDLSTTLKETSNAIESFINGIKEQDSQYE